MITIGITTHNRLDILKKMAWSLYQSNLSVAHNIRIYDDHSDEFDIAELQKLFPNAASIKVNKKNIKADKNTFQMYKDFLNTSDTYLFNADSDLIFRNDWLDKALKFIKKTSGILTLFNAYTHKLCEEADDDLCIKRTIGCAGTLLRRERVEELVNHIDSLKNAKGLDWQFSRYFNNADIPIYCVKNSLVQHIGYTGQNSSYSFDFGKNFKIESVEQGQIINDILENYAEELEHLEKKRLNNFIYHFTRVIIIIMKKLLPKSFYERVRHKYKK
jgi:hypothetical protein